jgi:hypothetical protein
LEGLSYVATASYFADGRLAEIFLNSFKADRPPTLTPAMRPSCVASRFSSGPTYKRFEKHSVAIRAGKPMECSASLDEITAHLQDGR